MTDAGRTEQRPERTSRNAERGERGNRPERSERRPRTPRQEDDVTSSPEQASVSLADADAPQVTTETGEASAPSDTRTDGSPREKRPRDRYGRERRPRGDRVERSDPADVQTALALEDAPQDEAAPRKSYFTQTAGGAATAPVTSAAAPQNPVEAPTPANEVAMAAAMPQAIDQPSLVEAVAAITSHTSQLGVTAKPVASAPAPVVAKPPVATVATVGMPKVQPFALPLGELAQVAEQSGLNWVNSDAAKVAAVQAAIAAELKPMHAPRERLPVARLDDRPLVLVETRRDLRNMTLPFENTEQV